MQSTPYEYIITVARQRSISAAAKELCITQPALTKYINRLETNLGVKLFDRTVSPIEITVAGKKYIEKASMILDIERNLQYDMKRISNKSRGEIHVGMNTEFCGNTLPYVLPEFRYRYPEIRVVIHEGHNQFLFEELEAGRLDLAYAAYSPRAMDFTYEFMYNEPVLLAVPMAHPLTARMDMANNSPLTPYYLEPERVRGCDFIVVTEEHGMGVYARNMFHKYNLNPHIVYELNKHETALRLASTGMGMVFTPAATPLRTQLLKQMAYFSIEKPLSTRSRGFYYSKNVPLSDAARCFTQVFAELGMKDWLVKSAACQLLFPSSRT